MFKPIIKDKKYVIYEEKPIYSEDYNVEPNILKLNSELVVVMQGPLKMEEHFTYETLKIYLKSFNNCKFILSTWKSESKEEINKIKDLGVIVLLNDPPNIKGLWNINNQILSTQNGLKYAKEIGAEYVIKTRTDQRLYETNISEFLFNIIKVFPVYDKKVQKSRLVTLSMNTFKYRLYDISDMFLFGHIDDVIKFWSCDFEKRQIFPEYHNMLEYCKLRPCEIYFTSEYLSKIGHDCKWTLQDSWQTYARYFCVVDSVCVGLYWPKYSHIINRWRNFFGQNPSLEELTFKEWLSLYLGLENIKVPENLLIDGWPEKEHLYFNENLITDLEKKIKKTLSYKIKRLFGLIKD